MNNGWEECVDGDADEQDSTASHVVPRLKACKSTGVWEPLCCHASKRRIKSDPIVKASERSQIHHFVKSCWMTAASGQSGCRVGRPIPDIGYQPLDSQSRGTMPLVHIVSRRKGQTVTRSPSSPVKVRDGRSSPEVVKTQSWPDLRAACEAGWRRWCEERGRSAVADALLLLCHALHYTY